MYHTLSDYQDQSRNHVNHQKQSTTKTSNTLTSMKKGVMVNGSEVYYGKGIKVDPNKKSNGVNNINRINKKLANNRTNKIGHNRPIQYTSKEEVKEVIKKTVVNKRVEEMPENIVDLNKPHCSISVRMFNGTCPFGFVYILIRSNLSHILSNNSSKFHFKCAEIKT